MDKKSKLKPLEFACAMCDTVMNTYSVSDLPGPKDRFNYIQGVFLLGMERCYMLSGREKYLRYIKSWVDYMISDDGTIRCQKDLLDDLMPAVLLIRLYRETGEEKYKIALDASVGRIETWRRNIYGGFFHKFETPDQMWLDGLFMVGILLTSYAAEFDRPEYFDEMYHQTKLMYDHMRDTKTGLYYHAWDASGVESWADSHTGCSAEFWGRAMGWVAVALCEMLDFFPQQHEKRPEIIGILSELLESVVKYQDSKTGRWYQIIDKGENKENWLETSCSSLFTYALHKAVRLGYVDESYSSAAQKGYDGVIDVIRITDGGEIIIPEISVGTNVMEYDGYIARPRVENDNHGTGTFVLMCVECAIGDAQITNKELRKGHLS